MNTTAATFLTSLVLLAAFSCSTDLKAQDSPCDVVVPGQVFCDDFSDGDISDGVPVSWVRAFNSGQLAVVDESLLLTDNGNSAFATITETDNVTFTGTSIRTQVRIQQGDWIGVASRSNEALNRSYSGFVSADTAFIGVGGDLTILAETPVDFDVTQSDVTLQLDVFNDTVELWAWPSDQAMPSNPTLSSEGVGIPDGKIFLWTGSEFGGVGSGAFRYVQVATQPIPEPSTAILGLVSVLGLLTLRRRHS